MAYLYKLYFFDPLKTGVKRELFVTSGCIDFITWHKQQDTTAEGTRIQTSIITPAGPMLNFVSHVVDGNPENCNQIIFDGLFFKCPVQYVGEGGSIKKYTSWINPENISSMYSFQPDCTEVFFRSGSRILISNKMPDIMTALIEHNKKVKARRNDRYGKAKPEAAF